MNILLLSTGGGGGNILRSVKALFRRDLAVAQQTNPQYAERLRRAVTTRFLDTNEFSLTDLPPEERIIIGATTTRRLGSMHNPQLAKDALEESRSDVASLFQPYSVIVIIGTGGKGTGAGTIVPLAKIARQQKKLVLPIFVRPSFEWHEVEKHRYDHALTVIEQFDASRMRLIEILNDRGYSNAEPQPQSVVWERMNRPIARALRGLLYVLWDLSQVDPSDLSALFAGEGRLRIGFSELDPPDRREPSDEQIDTAVRECWQNAYYAFTKPVGTSLVCIHGDWSNVVDAKIKGGLAKHVLNDIGVGAYNPLYARVSDTPKPWGVTALFAEDTGKHPALDIDWPVERARRSPRPARRPKYFVSCENPTPSIDIGLIAAPASSTAQHFSSFWDFALAVNRSDPAALVLARDGAECEIPIEGTEIRKLLTTVWFRQVFANLSQHWRERILDALLTGVTIPNHTLRYGRRTMLLSEVTAAQLRETVSDTVLSDAVRTDLQLLLAVGSFWGADAIKRFGFTNTDEASTPVKPPFWPLASSRSWLGRFRLQTRPSDPSADRGGALAEGQQRRV